MIQRIQSVYLLLTAILMAVTVCSPLVALQSIDTAYLVKSMGVYNNENMLNYATWGVISIACLSALLAFVDIFLFKKRKVQIKICNLNSVLIIFFYITLAVYLYFGMSNYPQITFNKIEYGMILPFIALILNILATSKIKADEKLVQSLNRIR